VTIMREEGAPSFEDPDNGMSDSQARYVYLPEGAVVIDRSGVKVEPGADIPTAKSTTQIPPSIPVDSPQPAPGVQFVPPQPGVQYVNLQPGQQYVNLQPGQQYVNLQPGQQYVNLQPGMQFVQPPYVYGRRRRSEQLILRRRYRRDWVHSLTVAFASYLILVTIIPLVLSGIFGVVLHASKSDNPELGIQNGELMISHLTPAVRLIQGELVLLRDKNSWNLQVRQITSTSTTGTTTVLTTNSGFSATSSDVLTMESATNVRNITSVVPIFGYIVSFFSSVFGKMIGAAIILVLNVRHMLRKRRGRIHDERLAFVAK